MVPHSMREEIFLNISSVFSLSLFNFYFILFLVCVLFYYILAYGLLSVSHLWPYNSCSGVYVLYCTCYAHVVND